MLLPTPSLRARDRRAGRRGRRRTRAARPGPAARAARSAPGAPLRRGAARRRDHRARPAARSSQRPAPGAPRGRADHRRRRLPGRRGRAGGRPSDCRSWSCRRVSTPIASCRSTPIERAEARGRFGLPDDAALVVSVSRLVPRKGMDVLIEAAARLAPDHPELMVAIGGDGRDRERLERLVGADRRAGAPARPGAATTTCPALYGCADVFAMLCRNRWAGLEQEGFGIVFLEAAACGVRQVAGDSGGAAEAVVDGETGLVVGDPRDSTRWQRRCSASWSTRRRDGRWAGGPATSRARVRLRRARRPPRRRARSGHDPTPTDLSTPASTGEPEPGSHATGSRWDDRVVPSRPTPLDAAATTSTPAPRCCGPIWWAPWPSSSPRWPLPRSCGPVSRRRGSRVGGAVRRRLPGVRLGVPGRRRAEPHRGGRSCRRCSSSRAAPRPRCGDRSSACWPSQVVAAVATAAVRPFTSLAFGVLAPMCGLGLIALWAGRHGTFPRSEPTSRRPPAWPTRP